MVVSATRLLRQVAWWCKGALSARPKNTGGRCNAKNKNGGTFVCCAAYAHCFISLWASRNARCRADRIAECEQSGSQRGYVGIYAGSVLMGYADQQQGDGERPQRRHDHLFLRYCGPPEWRV